MTDEEIRKLAIQSKQSKFCDKYKKPWICHKCPIAYDGFTCSNDYEDGFVDGFKAAYDVPIEKIKSL